MTSDSGLSFDASSIFSREERLIFVSMAVEEETEIRSDLRLFAESLKKGFVSDKGFDRIIYTIIDQKKGNRSQAPVAADFFSVDPPIDGATCCRAEENRLSIERKASRLSEQVMEYRNPFFCLKRSAPQRRSLLLERSARLLSFSALRTQHLF
jgi:hypothetical protein